MIDEIWILHKRFVRWSPVAWCEIPGNNKLVCSAFHANQPITATTNVLRHCYTFKIHGAIPAILQLHLVARCYNGYPLILTHCIYIQYNVYGVTTCAFTRTKHLHSNFCRKSCNCINSRCHISLLFLFLVFIKKA